MQRRRMTMGGKLSSIYLSEAMSRQVSASISAGVTGGGGVEADAGLGGIRTRAARSFRSSIGFVMRATFFSTGALRASGAPAGVGDLSAMGFATAGAGGLAAMGLV